MTAKGNRDVIEVGSARAARGELARGFLEIGQRASSTPIEAPVIIVNGAHDGPALWIQSAMHGDEFDGTAAIWRALQHVDPATLRGALLIFPVLNLSAHEAYERVSPIDGLDINRIYPGNPNTSYTNRLAWMTENMVLEHADYFVDLHGGGNHFSVVYYTLFHAADNEAGEESRKLAVAAGSRFVWASKDTWLQNGIFTRITKVGIPAMLVECGGEGRLHEHNVRDHYNSLVNMMKHLDMIDGEVVPPSDPLMMFKSADFFFSSKGGFITNLVSLGDTVEKGQPIVEIRNAFGDIVETIYAPTGPSVVFAIRTYGITDGGGSLGILGVKA
jgi:predicted deacylase